MKHLFFLLIAAVVLGFTQCAPPADHAEETAEAAPQQTHADTVKRGEYLVNTMGCDDCHSPKQMGAQGPELIPGKRLSGHPSDQPLGAIPQGVVEQGWVMFAADLTASVGPWGTTFSGNLTSDETGIGNWTVEQFKKCLREGKYKGLDNTRPLLPPMPWQAYGQLNDADLEAIFAYLQTTDPVKNVPPPPVPPAGAQQAN